MTTRNEKLNRLTIASPCLESWQTMSGGEHTRFCARCEKHVYDLAALEAREVEALIQATQGRLCARITRDRSGRMITREPAPPPFQQPAAAPLRRTSPVVAAVITAVVGLTGAGWAEPPISAPIAATPAAPDLAHPSGSGGAVLDGQVMDDQGSPLPGATAVLHHPEEGWRLVAVTDAQGRFQFRDLPSGVYDVGAELEGFYFETAAGLALGPEGQQITLTGVLFETDQVLAGVLMTVDLSLDAVFQQSHVVVAATVGPSVTLEELGDEDVVRKIRTELRITSVLKGEPRGRTLQIDHYVIPGEPESFLPGDSVLALLKPDDGRPDSRVYVSADPLHALHPLPADPRLRPDLGVDEAGWRALSYIADTTNDNRLQELVAQAITQVEARQRQLAAGSEGAAGEKRLRARIAAIDEELRRRFVQMLSGGR